MLIDHPLSTVGASSGKCHSSRLGQTRAVVQGGQPQQYLRKNFLLTASSNHRTGYSRQEEQPLSRGCVLICMVMSSWYSVFTRFQPLSEHVPGTFSCHPHIALLVGITANAATICTTMTTTKTVPLPPCLHLQQQQTPSWLTGRVPVTGVPEITWWVDS